VIGLGLAFVRARPRSGSKLAAAGGLSAGRRVVGPFSPGLVIDQHLTLQLADIGVVL